LSFFGNIDFKLLENLTISGGLRYIDESKEFFSGYEGDLILTGQVAAPGLGRFPLIAPFTDTGDFDDTITRFAVDWQVAPNHLLYASRAEGFRSGGFSIRGSLSEQIAGQNNCDGGVVAPGNIAGVSTQCPQNNFLRYEPENVSTIEIGSKNTFLDGDLTFNAAYFTTDIDGLQTVAIAVTGVGAGTNTYINNLPKAEIDGFEFDLIYKPEAIDGLTINGILGLQDGEVTDGALPAVRSQAGPGGSPGFTGQADIDFTGTQNGLGRIADYNYNIGVTYEFDMGPGTVRLNSNYNYIDDHTLSAGFGLQDVEEGYGLLNAYIGYDWNNYSISLTGKNLTNVDYRVGSLASVYFDRWADDMNWFAEIKAEF
jgi:iron complex outermembrane receptor protein